MRVFVFLLVLVNLLFFAWARGHLGSGDADDLRVEEQLRPERIRIVSKDQPPEETREYVEEEVLPAAASEEPPASSEELPALPERPPAADALPEDVCVVLNGVSQSEADSLTRLFAEKLPAFRLSRTGTPGLAYWVHIPPFSTRREAESRVAELRRLGVQEYFIMQEGAGNFAISLGLFSTPGAAESALAALRERGVRSARLVERAHKSALSQIELTGPRLQAGEMRQTLAETLPRAKLGVCGRTTAQ
ncbi:MAG: SPOR domain-containing protein [Candidatus Accumulibacter sp.]|jgi:hypothetical protein|nr:SPOR domain-containing protein [Accumulibacter sp.]